MNDLKQSRATDRAKIADILRQTAEAVGATVEITTEWPSAPSRDTLVQLWLGGVSASIIIGATNPEGFCVCWNVTTDSPKRMTPAFGSAAASSVNPYHRRKCTAFYNTLAQTLDAFERTLKCIADGTGLEE